MVRNFGFWLDSTFFSLSLCTDQPVSYEGDLLSAFKLFGLLLKMRIYVRCCKIGAIWFSNVQSILDITMKEISVSGGRSSLRPGSVGRTTSWAGLHLEILFPTCRYGLNIHLHWYS